jgi:hypothetical protein
MSHAKHAVPHQRGDKFDPKTRVEDYIDPFQSFDTKLISRAKFKDKNTYFASWKCIQLAVSGIGFGRVFHMHFGSNGAKWNPHMLTNIS